MKRAAQVATLTNCIYNRRMPDKNLEKLVLKSLLAAANGAIGSGMFQQLFVRDRTTGRVRDVMNNGELSCAYFISSLLLIFGLIDRAHATVATTVASLKEAGWQETQLPVPGAIAVWPELHGHEHIGIVVDDDMAISNAQTTRAPKQHSLTLADSRKPVAFYVHPNL